jgi:outer membrane protein assembly factor BamB
VKPIRGLAVTAAFAVAACGQAPGSAPAGAHFQVKASGCAPIAAGYDITDAGTAAWAVQLPDGASRPDFQPAAISPVAIGGLAVYAHGDVISARRLTDGSEAWRSTSAGAGGQVGDLLAWHGELIAVIAPVYLGQQPVDMRVQALSPLTGAVRWTADLGPGDLYNDQVITSGGVLAVLTEHGGTGGRGKLIAVGLSAGRVLWSQPYGKDELTDGPTAAGPVIVMAEHGTVTGFDASTGAVRWRHGGMPGPVASLAGSGGLVLLYDLLQQAGPGQRPVPSAQLFPVTALDASSGAVRWRARTAGPVSELSAAGGLIVIGTSGNYTLTLLSPAGRVLWSVPEYVANDMTWVNTGTDLVYVATESEVNAKGIHPGLTTLTDRRLGTGAVRWSARLPDYSDAQVVRPAGGNLVVTESGPPAALAVDPATGRTDGRATLTPLVITTPLTVAGSDTLVELTSAPCLGPAAPEASGSRP